MFNPYIVVPLAVWAIAQFIKFILAAARGRLDFKYLYASGGMPSVHAAVVTALATTAFLLEGGNSPIFGLTVILAGIVMYDSFGVRRSSGEQAIAINLILESLNRDRIRLLQPQHHLREVLGHQPSEVAAGAALGLLLGGIFNIEKLGPLFAILSTPIPSWVTLILAGKAVLFIIVGFIARWLLLRKYGKVVTVNNAIKRSYSALATYGAFSGLLAFLQYEKIQVSTWAVWVGLIDAAAIAALIWLISKYRTSVPLALQEYKERQAKEKWMPGPNKERRKKAAKAKKRK